MNLRMKKLLMTILLTTCCTTPLLAQASNAIEFRDSTGNNTTAIFGWQGDAANGAFFIQTPGGNNVEVKSGDMTVGGTVRADAFAGDGSALTNLPQQSVAVNDVYGLQSALNTKSDSAKVALQIKDSLARIDQALAGKPSVAQVDASISDALGNYSSTVEIDGVTGLQSALNTKADTGSVYTRSVLTGLLSNKADLAGGSFTGSISVEGGQNRSFSIATNGLNYVDLILRRSNAGAAYDIEWKQHIDYSPNLQFRATTSANGTKYPLTLSPEGCVAIGKTNVNILYALDVGGEAYKSTGGTAWVTSSDKRLKRDIVPIDSSLVKLTSLRGVHFRWKEPSNHGNDTTVQTGLIAQEVQQVFPDWISEDGNGYKTLQPKGFEAIVAEALKEVMHRIELLEKENLELRKEIAAIREQRE